MKTFIYTFALSAFLSFVFLLIEQVVISFASTGTIESAAIPLTWAITTTTGGMLFSGVGMLYQTIEG